MSWLQGFTGHPPSTVALFAFVVFLAAVVRGYAGFGFSALVVSSLSLLIPVASIVPVVIILEAAASVQMVPKVFSKIDRRLLTILMIASVISLPLGQYLLLDIDPEKARLAVSGLVFALVAFILSGRSLAAWRGTGMYLTVGFLSGLANGMVAMGGLVVSTALLASGLAIEPLRATLVGVFFFTGCYALASGLVNGLVTAHTVGVSVVMLVPLALGIHIGNRGFDPARTTLYRRATLTLLMLLASAGVYFSLYR